MFHTSSPMLKRIFCQHLLPPTRVESDLLQQYGDLCTAENNKIEGREMRCVAEVGRKPAALDGAAGSFRVFIRFKINV